MNKLKFWSRNKQDPSLSQDDPNSAPSTANPSVDGRGDPEKAHGTKLTSKLPHITLRTFLMAILVAMGGFIFGYDTGQISGFLEMKVFLQRFGTPTTPSAKNPSGYHFTIVRSGLIVAMLSIGTLVGCLIAGPLANKYGRKTCIPWWCLIFSVGVIIQMAVGSGKWDWVGIVVGRLVAGWGVGALSVLVPLYMAETSPVPVRGAIISCYQLFITAGIFVANCINFGTEKRIDTGSYRITMGVGFIWAIILGFGILLLPESPRHDFNTGRADRGRDTMAKFYGVPQHHEAIKSETAEIEKVMEATKGHHPWYEALSGPRMKYRIALAMGLQMGQQLTGANYFFYYGTTVFTGVGIKNPFVTAMILGGVNFGATFFGVWLARVCRRRESLYIGALWQTMCFLVFASVGQFQFKGAPDGSSLAKSSGTVMIVFACLFIVSFAITWGPLVWAVNGEMFPYRYRAVAMAFATASNWFWNFMLAFFTPFITGDIQYAYGYVFAGCNLAAFLVVYLFLMESRGKTLEEIDAMYLLHVNPIKSASFEFDEETKRNISLNVNTDAMHLIGKGKNMKKANEALGTGVLHQDQDRGRRSSSATEVLGEQAARGS